MEVYGSKNKTDFRDYYTTDQKSKELKLRIREHYKSIRKNQDLKYVKRMHQYFIGDNGENLKISMNIWQVLEELNKFIDVSDPDITLPNSQHMFQTAEALRSDGKPDWLQLIGLIHDAGKILYLRGNSKDGTSMEQQWGIAGDTFLVDYPIPETCVYPEYNKLFKLEHKNEKIGLDQHLCTWGHDEYLYQVLKHNPHNKIPEEGLYIIRYHSLYPWHNQDSYLEIEDIKDKNFKPWVKTFNQYDLYSKSQTTLDLDNLKIYYQEIIQKYLGNLPLLW